MLNTGLLFGQVEPEKPKDTVSLTPRELKLKEIDSLVKLIRKEFYLNNYHKTIEVGEKSLKIAQEYKDYTSIFRISSLMGNAFLSIEDTIQAKRIFLNTISEAEIRNDTTWNLITAQIDLGNYFALQEKRTQAIKIYSDALPLAQKLKDTTSLFILNFNLAELNLDLEDIEKSEFYVKQTNNYIVESTAEAYKAVAKLNLGRLYFIKGYFAFAKKYLRESISMAISVGYTDPLIEAHEFLAEAEANLGNYQVAYDLQKKTAEYRSEKYQTEKINAIETVTAKFKLNQFQQDLKQQEVENVYNKQAAKRETTILWIKIASAILFVAAIFLFISDRKRKKLLVNLTEKNEQYLQAKEKSDELAKAKGILFSNITHELRTPMYGIMGVSSLLMEDNKLKNHHESLKSLKFSAHYLQSLINNVLEITKIDSTKKEELSITEFSLLEIVENVVKSSKFISPDNSNTYNVNIDKKIPTILLGDELKLSQVLMNLIGNSSKFTTNGTINIDITRQENKNDKICLRFVIADDGIGISKEKQENLYDEFAQISSGDQFHGTGLGMPIVKKILDLHDSEIKLKSELGEGTEIEFELCYSAASSQEPEIDLKGEEKSLIFKGKHILAVDDNKINQIVTKKMLTLYGAKVTVASGGVEAIEMAKNKKFDLILMDINMPEVDGFQATVGIREFDETIPIVALTAVELEKVVGAHSFSLMNDLIIKPYPTEVFVSTILKHL